MKEFKYQKIPIVLMVLSVFLLILIMSLSFSGKIGQARIKLRNSIATGIFSNVMESSSGLVSYNINKEKEVYPFPLNMTSEFYSLHNFVYASTINLQNNEIRIYETNNEDNNKTDNKISFNKIPDEILTKEYILTNGAIFNGNEYQDYITMGALNDNKNRELPVRIMDGAIDFSEFKVGSGGEGEAIYTMRSYNGTPFTLDNLKDVNFLIRNFYICAGGVVIKDELFDSELMLNKDMTIKTSKDKPQILIYHTHSQEAFIDSKEGVTEDTVVGVGDYLTEVLEKKYGYNVIHDRSVYDVIDGKLNRNLAYNYAREGVLKILEENPSIDVIIDLHRDGNQERTIIIDGKETAQIMLFNGLSRNEKGSITRLDNPNLQDNLAFSFKLQLKSLEMYPQLIYKNYLEVLRYNLDLRPKSLLLEWGDAQNTLQSAMNAVEPFADVLDAVLQGR
ncbi:MAG: hypothetical protein GX321_08080 [Clostridiales bacterium]|nr:hypothetical protein [Clostridiales bacterium]